MQHFDCLGLSVSNYDLVSKCQDMPFQFKFYYTVKHLSPRASWEKGITPVTREARSIKVQFKLIFWEDIKAQ